MKQLGEAGTKGTKEEKIQDRKAAISSELLSIEPNQ